MNVLEKWLEESPSFIQKQWEKSGFTAWTPIQEKMIPLAEGGDNILAEAPTGSGKTLAYLLPSLKKINKDVKQAQLLIVAPSRELVMQIHDEVQKWTEGSSIESCPLIGGANIKRQLEKLKKKPQVIVGTPGRLDELQQLKKLKLHEVKVAVFDEVDQLFVKEHEKKILSLLKSTKQDTQLLFCSATIAGHVEKNVKIHATDLEVVRIEMDKSQLDQVQHLFYECEKRDKEKVLRKLVHQPGFYGLAFSNDSYQLNKMIEAFKYHGEAVAALQGSTSKQEREKAMRTFRKGDVDVLFSTDVASRGLDFENITHVVQVDLANDAKQYVHRSGRTGRAGKKGIVVSIVTAGEKERLQQIADQLGFKLEKWS